MSLTYASAPLGEVAWRLRPSWQQGAKIRLPFLWRAGDSSLAGTLQIDRLFAAHDLQVLLDLSALPPALTPPIIGKLEGELKHLAWRGRELLRLEGQLQAYDLRLAILPTPGRYQIDFSTGSGANARPKGRIREMSGTSSFELQLEFPLGRRVEITGPVRQTLRW